MAASNPAWGQRYAGGQRVVSSPAHLPAAGPVVRTQASRAQWQPVRPVQATEELPRPQASNGKRVAVPTPLAEGEVIYEDQSVLGGPLEGEIIYEGEYPYHGDYQGDFLRGDYHGGAYGCDSMGSCGDGCCGDAVGSWRPCLTLCFPRSGWVSAEYLGWWQTGMDLPPLATTSVGGAVPPAGQAGVIGHPQTRTLFGGDEVLDDGFNGGRLQFGLWLDQCRTWAVAGEFFGLSSRSEGFSASSNGDRVLTRPFINVLDGLNDAQIVAYPGIANGSLSAVATSELQGAGFHFRRQTNSHTGCGGGLLCTGCSMFHSRTDMLFGYRFLQLDESVGINELVNGVNPVGVFRINDQFDTVNKFNGFDMGMNYQRTRGPWSLDLLAKLAIGNTNQRVSIRGTTVIDGTAHQGGLLAQPSNIGTYSRDRFTILPELGAKVGFQLTHNLKLTGGYTMIFWSNVVRPGDQIDLGVNPDQLPPAIGNGSPARPEFVFRDSDYWVQGLSFGGEFTW